LLSHVEEEVLGVQRLSLLVGIVGRSGFDLRKEGLLNVELADVGNGSATDSVVGKLGGAVVNDGYLYR
jgi:hypothetical protein